MSDELPIFAVIDHCRAAAGPDFQGRVRLLESILVDLGHKRYDDRKPYCWCDQAIGDPQQPDHTAACKRARALDLAPLLEDSE